MIAAATKYATIPAARPCPPRRRSSRAAGAGVSPVPAAFSVFVKKAAELTPSAFFEWWHREMRWGGSLHEYLRREKATTTQRYRAVAKREHGFKQNNKSDVRKVATVPLRDYLRWQAEDEHFFEDDKNLKSLKRDNPDVCVYL